MKKIPKVMGTKKIEKSNYDDAVDHIKCAIQALGETAVTGDTKAKEAITNLSVILFDIK